MLEARHLTIGYAARRENRIVQQDLSLSLPSGSMICLIGPNGCGKSTLLRTLAGLQEPLNGDLCIRGKSFRQLSLLHRAQLLSVVLTERIEVSHLTVWMLVALGRNPYTGWGGRLNAEDQKLVGQSLEAVGLSGYSSRPISSLSDGERQRALIAKALAQDTPFILLDEPTAHLDINNRIETMLLLSRLAHVMGKGILLSTHELDLALQTADRLWLMRPSEGVAEGIPQELIEDGRLQQVFSGQSFYFDSEMRRFVIRESLK